jgi:hypothetical protein
MTDIPISQVIDHDLSSTKIVISFHANMGSVSLKVTTKFARDEVEELKDYRRSVIKAFTAVYNDHTEKMGKRKV